MFRNWTTRDFTYPWAKVPYTFEAGKEYELYDFSKEDRPAIEYHFAKHLAVRELHGENLQANDPKFDSYVEKAIGKKEGHEEMKVNSNKGMVSEINTRKK